MPRHLLQESVDRLAAMAEPPASAAGGAGGPHRDTFLIMAAVLCFLLCVVGLALVARWSRLCNPSAFSVDAMAAKAPCKGIKKKALQSLPTVSWAAPEQSEQQQEVPECAICLAEFALGDEVRVLPTCGHGFHAACVDVWLLSSSTCPSCRRALVVSLPPATEPPTATRCCERPGVALQNSATGVAASRCRSSAQ
ncbi:probable E3 ubiquitin-protein ligase ATL44 [Lolium perenne]|uniref:probable E3 ubiquitin-protein ligase ATL44 n=1 Tax=Lolium perenne TaxID=4522 RepID=UPI0021EA70D0|nr:probable E3 ubiquitin-protein ligase ATL44 [Lolium perenne]